MAKPVLTQAHFHNEEAAFAYVEAHLWPEGPVCPHCGNVDQKAIGRLTGKSSRPGLRKCYACRKTFTVRIGSIFEDSHFPLHRLCTNSAKLYPVFVQSPDFLCRRGDEADYSI